MDNELTNFTTDLNLGCPQETAKEGHFGAYLLGQKDWPLIQDLGVWPEPHYLSSSFQIKESV